MEAYPRDYVAHNYPFVILSGFNGDVTDDNTQTANSLFMGDGVTVNSDWPLVDGKQSNNLLRELLSWHADTDGALPRAERKNDSASRLHLKVTGRRHLLPPRKARQPSESLLLGYSDSEFSTKSMNLVLHSPISPLTPTSPLFPDGIMTPLWVAKHLHYVPSVFVSFFNFASDPARDSIHDNQLKNEILGIKASLTRSEYKIRLVVVLLSDKAISDAPEIEDRLWNIKRATGLDLKHTLLFLPLDSSPEQLSAFCSNLMSVLYSMCLDRYRDLSKHSRRKKGKGVVPAPTLRPNSGTSQVLSLQAWGVRYEFKLGVLAEFRGEIEVASRHYSAVLEAMALNDGIFEITPYWSLRWNEARMLCDICLIRLIRALFHMRSTTAAVQVLIGYRSRFQDLLDRSGKGSANYGWKVWDSRMAIIMSEFIESAKLSTFSSLEPSEKLESAAHRKEVFCTREGSSASAERLSPWHLLHHSGYWLALAARYSNEMRILAEEAPEKDEVPSDMSTIIQTAHQNQTLDSFYCSELYQDRPIARDGDFNQFSETIDLFGKSANSFDAWGQARMAAKMRLQIGIQFVTCEHYSEAFVLLRSLWESMLWRKENWSLLACEVTRMLFVCAMQVQSYDIAILTACELANKTYNNRGYEPIDFTYCLKSYLTSNDAVHVDIEDKKITPFLTPSLIFTKREGYVGEPIFLQLCLSSNAQSNSSPTQVSQVNVNFEGPVDSVTLKHKSERGESSVIDASGTTQTSLQRINTNKDSLEGQADLTMSPGQRRIYEIELISHKAGFITASNVKVTINGCNFTFSVRTSFSIEEAPANVWLHSSGNLKRSNIRGFLTTTILPKSPKVEVKFSRLDKSYYIDENIILDLIICNSEDEEAYTSMEVQLLVYGDDPIEFSWVESPEVDTAGGNNGSVALPGKKIGLLNPSTSVTQKINFTAPSFPSRIVLEAKILYHLKSDLQTVLSKTSSTQLEISEPFSIDFQFYPRVHPALWPNYFVYNGYENGKESDINVDSSIDQKPTGLKQRWQLQARVTSLVHESTTIDEVTAVLFGVNGGISCRIQETPLSVKSTLENDETQEWHFMLDTQKLSIEDRGSSSVDLNLMIKWRRLDARDKSEESVDYKSTETTIEVPQLPVPSSEPRVLATGQLLVSMPSVFLLEYTLENPTIHFLTFDLAMEASEDFAFSGCKYGSLNLLPISRQTIRINIMPLTGNKWIRPQLRVADRYFNKTLKILPTEGLAADKDGLMLYAGDVPLEDLNRR